jgi:hypothetical protein
VTFGEILRLLLELLVKFFDSRAQQKAADTQEKMQREIEYQRRRAEIVAAHHAGDRRRLYRLWLGLDRVPKPAEEGDGRPDDNPS